MKACEMLKRKKIFTIKVWNDAAEAFISSHVVCGMSATILNAPILSRIITCALRAKCSNSCQNDTGSSAPWLHRALLFVTVQHIFQGHVSRCGSGSVNEKSSVPLIGWSAKNNTWMFLLKDVDLGVLWKTPSLQTSAASLGCEGQEMTSWQSYLWPLSRVHV